MAILKQIIFLKDKSGVFKLRDDIKSFGYDERTGQHYVQFKKGDNYLHYNPANVDVANYTRQLEPPFRVTMKNNGHTRMGRNMKESFFRQKTQTHTA